MINIVVDAMGGDNSPLANVEGTVRALNALPDLQITLVGDCEQMKQQLDKLQYDASRLTLLHASEVISCNDKPTEAIRTKKDSSMTKALELLHTDENARALVTVGSTGALLAGTVMRVGRIKGVKRPAFCPILPTVVKDRIVAICDSGANVDCDPQWLQQFAVMGSLYLSKAFGVNEPRVALLNVGVEEEKGDALRKETYQLLKDTPEINFVGNMESRDLLSGKFDLVVCDGFAGNVLLKSTEGACLELMRLLKGAMMSSFTSKMGALLVKKKLYEVKDLMDYNKYGGAVLLGAAKTVVKGHGSSNAESVFHCIEQAYRMETGGLTQAIAQAIRG